MIVITHQIGTISLFTGVSHNRKFINIELFELKIRNSLINNGKEAATVYSIRYIEA